MRWQDATIADIYPMLIDVADGRTPEQDRAAAQRLVALGALEQIDG